MSHSPELERNLIFSVTNWVYQLLSNFRVSIKKYWENLNFGWRHIPVSFAISVEQHILSNVTEFFYFVTNILSSTVLTINILVITGSSLLQI